MIDAEVIYQSAVRGVAKLQRGRVWCTFCGATKTVESAECLRRGWPVCCGYTMTIDSPAERAERKP